MPNLFQKRWFQVFFLLVAVLACYSFMLQGDFRTLDDQASIVRNDVIKDFRNAGKVLRTSYFGTNDYYRPLVLLNYMLEYHFVGLDPFVYYLDNILLHAAVVILMFLTLARIFPSRNLAFATALLYAVHPVHWETVSNIPDRAIILCTLFMLLAFWFFLRRKDFPGAHLIALICFALSLLAKESAVVFPLALLSYEFFLGRRPGERTRQWAAPILPFFAGIGFYFWLRLKLGITGVFMPRDADFIFLSFLTFLRGVVTYVRLFFLPFDLHFARAHALLNGPDALIILIFYGLCGVALFKARRRVSAAEWFLLSWFALALLPVSQIWVAIFIQPGYISLAEHFLYAPAIGACGIMGLAAQRIYFWNKKRRVCSPALLVCVAAVFYGYLALALVENGIYARSEKAMLERAVRFEPQNARNLLPLSNVYVRGRRFDEAEKRFRQVLAQDPLDAHARIGLGKSLCDQGKYWEGLAQYDLVVDPGVLKPLLEKNKRLTLLILEKRYLPLTQRAAALADDHYRLGVVYAKQGRNDEAIAQFRTTVAKKADHREAWFNLASSLALKNNFPGAAAAYQKTLTLSSKDDGLRYQANVFLARVYRSLGRSPEAAGCEKEATRIAAALSDPKKAGDP